ncbi:MAG TPA: biopolymer transporter ExbD [Syntrophorhabdales bacterium]|nr:biopolymer transporter ExbD [Syntrophorhabdales bacterium]
MEEKEFDYISMIPLIDVMLVLLTIVLMTSTFIMGGMIRVELPRVSGEQEAVARTRSVEMDQTGRLYYDGLAVSLEEFKGRLSNVSRDVPFLIRADKRVPLQYFVEVLGTVKGMGFKRVSVQTERERQ